LTPFQKKKKIRQMMTYGLSYHHFVPTFYSYLLLYHHSEQLEHALELAKREISLKVG